MGPVIKKLGNWSFHVVDLQRTDKKCTKNYFARVQPLFCSLNLLFGDVIVSVAVVFCVRSLLGSLSDNGNVTKQRFNAHKYDYARAF